MTVTTYPTADGRPAPVRDAPSPETEIGALFGELSEEARILIRQEAELARAEVKESMSHASGVGVGFGAAALVGYLALAVLAVAAGLGLAEAMPAWLAFLIVGVVLVVVAGITFLIGRKNLKALSPVPRKTIESLKENMTWLRARIS